VVDSPNYMFWIKNILIVSVLLLLPATAPASDAMSWSACVEETSANNPEVQSARSTLDSSISRAKGAYSGYLPKVSGDVNYNKGNLSTSSQGTMATQTYSAAVTLQQNVFAGLRDKGTVDQTAAMRNADAANFDKVKVKVSYDLKMAFADLLYAQESSNLEDEIIMRRGKNLAMVDLRFKAGMENRGSFLLSKAFLAQARYEKQQALHAITVARQKMVQVLGMSDASDIRISGRIPIDEPEKNPDMEEIAFATPDYIQIVEDEHAAKAGVTIARSNFIPKLDVFATAARQGISWPPRDNNTTIGANLSIPIFYGTSNYFNYKSSRSDLMAARLNRTDVRQQILSKLEGSHANFIDAFRKLSVDREFVEAATVRAEIARSKYKNGMLSFEDWDIIENDLIAKQKAVIRGQHELYITEATWMQAQGRGVIP